MPNLEFKTIVDNGGIIQLEGVFKKLFKEIDIGNMSIKRSEEVTKQLEYAYKAIFTSSGELSNKFKNLRVSADQFNVALNKVKVTAPQTANALKTLQTSTQGMGNIAGQSRAALLSVSQAIQDAPYGIRGMSNNIDFLVQQFLYLKIAAGGTRGALVALKTAFTGVSGILIVSSAAMALINYFSQLKEKAKAAKDEIKEAFLAALGGVELDVKTLEKAQEANKKNIESKQKLIKFLIGAPTSYELKKAGLPEMNRLQQLELVKKTSKEIEPLLTAELAFGEKIKEVNTKNLVAQTLRKAGIETEGKATKDIVSLTMDRYNNEKLLAAEAIKELETLRKRTKEEKEIEKIDGHIKDIKEKENNLDIKIAFNTWEQSKKSKEDLDTLTKTLEPLGKQITSRGDISDLQKEINNATKEQNKIEKDSVEQQREYNQRIEDLFALDGDVLETDKERIRLLDIQIQNILKGISLEEYLIKIKKDGITEEESEEVDRLAKFRNKQAALLKQNKTLIQKFRDEYDESIKSFENIGFNSIISGFDQIINKIDITGKQIGLTSVKFIDFANIVVQELTKVIAKLIAMAIVTTFIKFVTGGGGDVEEAASVAENYVPKDTSFGARGMMINEPIYGIGASGQRYMFGEKGSELIIPNNRLANNMNNNYAMGGQNMNVVVTGKLKGKDIYISNLRYNNSLSTLSI